MFITSLVLPFLERYSFVLLRGSLVSAVLLCLCTNYSGLFFSLVKGHHLAQNQVFTIKGMDLVT